MFEKKLDEYFEAFGEGFPMYQLGRLRTEDEIIELIDTCLKEGKDAYDMGWIDEDAIY